MLHGALNLLVVLVILGAVSYAWRSGNCRWPGVLLSIVSVASATATAMLPGAVGLHWFYAALMASHLLMGVGEASLLIIAAVTFMFVDGRAFASFPQMRTFDVAPPLVGARERGL